ncbi:putative bifunctional diguanylate cyclase/phosphodiesterase [Cellulosimicrobium cellulans]|uniref:putative bifunctional diguanylate cyclase/phosphodiesterase n=1 Tax=Cellulosimicrobium cellulans TaxID=1710 RepID=UPI0016524078|nr:EAL domain-containing protein [Cellulosimicrobium cellulans]
MARADGALATARRRDDRVAVDAEAPAVPTSRGPGAAGGPREADLLQRLPAAVAAGELVVHFQPFVSVAAGRVEGAEALVRWQHPEHGLLGPDAFVPAAERTGLIRPVTLHVLDVALAQCARWRARGPATFGVSVNVSAHDLDDPRLVADVAAALDRHGLPPDALGLEVTETMAMRDAAQAGRTLRALADLGVRLAVDDYGVGYGSLDYLRRLPFTVLKVDRAFVAPAADDRVCAEILRSTVDLGHALGMYVVAEGVEDDRTLALLRGLGCDAAQGWALGRPGPAAAFDDRLAAPAPVN